MNIDKKALKSIVDEIEASRARQKGETEHQREVMKRAKDHALDPKAVRIVLQRRAMGETKRDEQDYYVHAYEMALGGKKDAAEALERGATVREAAKIGRISTGAAGNLAKAVQKPPFVDKPEDGDDGITLTKEQQDSVRPSHDSAGVITETAEEDARQEGESCGGIRTRSDVVPPEGLEAAPIAPQPQHHSTGERDGREGQDARGESCERDRGQTLGHAPAEHDVLPGRSAGDHEGAEASRQIDGLGSAEVVADAVAASSPRVASPIEDIPAFLRRPLERSEHP